MFGNWDARSYAQRPGSGDGERKVLLTRQIAFVPMPASVLFALLFA
jgi:hypothetical protein